MTRALNPRSSAPLLVLLGLVVFGLGAGVRPAAAVTVGDYQKWRHATRTIQATPTGLIEVRIGGIFRGLVLANHRLVAAGKGPDKPVLFCMPKGVQGAKGARADRMSGSALRKLLDKELKSPSRPQGEPWPPATRISVVILKILQREWRCPAGRPMLR